MENKDRVMDAAGYFKFLSLSHSVEKIYTEMRGMVSAIDTMLDDIENANIQEYTSEEQYTISTLIGLRNMCKNSSEDLANRNKKFDFSDYASDKKEE